MHRPAYRWVMTSANAPMVRADFEPFPPPPDAVVVQVAGCGVCHTDLGYFYDGVRVNHDAAAGARPRDQRHRGGRRRRCGSWIGRSVIVPAVLPCGTCDLCRRGRGTICRQQKMPGNDIQGGFASHIVVPARGLCPVDPGGWRRRARPCRCVGGGRRADHAVPGGGARRRGAGSLAVVVGVGGVGGYAVQVAHAFGATVVAIDVDDAKLAAVAQHGAALALNARSLDARGLRAAIQEFARGRGLPVTEWCIFECSGTAAGQLTAYGLLVHGATLSVVGFTMDRVELRLSNLMAFDARALGNWGCPPELYPAALDLVLDGRVRVKPFVEQHPLDDINAVFDAVHQHKVTRRVVLVPGV